MGFAFLLAQVSPPGENLSTFDTATVQAAQIRDLGVLSLFVAAGILLVVEGVLLYSLFRFRRQPATPPTEPPQVYGSIPIEIAWTVGPLLIVFILVLVVVRTENEVRPRFPEPDEPAPANTERLYVTVIGHQWWWEYRYTKFGSEKLKDVITANELHLPAGDSIKRPVYLTLESVDVCHSFWVPRLAGKTDLIPGKPNWMWFEPREKSTYFGQCAEFCGAQHANMLLRVEVQSRDDFRTWLDNQKEGPRQPSNSRAKEGQAIFIKQACVNCHRIGGPSESRFGPDLTHFASRKTIAAGMRPRTAENVRDWIRDPQAIKPGARMPAMNLGEDEVNKLVDYLMSLE